jgi:Fe-S oxidoreductase
VAAHNLDQFDPAAVDHVVTLCASCGGFLKNEYPRLFEAGSDRHRKALALAAKVIDFASLADRYWPEGKIVKDDAGPATAYHAPCHLRRGLGVVEPPRRLIDRSGCDYRPAPDEDVCCGCGGAYSVKFPEISEQTLKRKLGQVQGAGARVLATDCPGCVMQLRGGAAARGLDLRVMHTAELLADRIDQP